VYFLEDYSTIWKLLKRLSLVEGRNETPEKGVIICRAYVVKVLRGK